MNTRRFLQRGKHEVFLVSKRAKSLGTHAYYWSGDRINPKLAEHRPYVYDPARYRRSFLIRPTPSISEESCLPARVFCFWTGSNPMSRARLESLARLEQSLQLEVVLVTRDNVEDWVIPGHPLHPAYEGLSLVHRSDYLRAYFMHHHGGGYADIKEPNCAWAASARLLSGNPTKWVLGFQELGGASVTRGTGALGRDLRKYRHRIVGTSSFIARSQTPLTAEWLREVERRLDYYWPQLQEFPGGERGEVVGYPISWTHLLGRIFQPLCLKYMDRLIIDDRVKLKFTDYM